EPGHTQPGASVHFRRCEPKHKPSPASRLPLQGTDSVPFRERLGESTARSTSLGRSRDAWPQSKEEGIEQEFAEIAETTMPNISASSAISCSISSRPYRNGCCARRRRSKVVVDFPVNGQEGSQRLRSHAFRQRFHPRVNESADGQAR